MYIPNYTKNSDEKEILKLIQEYSFATLISLDETQNLSITHLPVLVETEGHQIKKIVTHMAAANPQAKHLSQNPQATFVFQGAHAYITPRWYRSGRDVPTWNYEVVHINGKAKLISDADRLITILKQTSNFYEGPQGWQFELPDDLEDPRILSRAIIGVELIPEQIEAKSKLGQNRGREDQMGVIEGISKERIDENSLAIQKKMLANFDIKTT